MSTRVSKTTAGRLAVVGLLAALGWAGTLGNSYGQNPPPPTYIPVGQTDTFWLARGAVIHSIHVTPGTGNVTAAVVPPNGFRVTGVAKGTASVTFSGTLTTYRVGQPPTTAPFTDTYTFIVD